MKITEEAQALIKGIMKANNLDILSVVIVFNEEGEGSLQLDLVSKDEVEGKRVVEMDSIMVAISEEDDEALSEAIFGADGEEITVELPHHHHHDHEGGCCGGHGHGHHGDGQCCGGHHHEDGQCCGGHEHHHEGECCCGDDCDCENKD